MALIAALKPATSIVVSLGARKTPEKYRWSGGALRAEHHVYVPLATRTIVDGGAAGAAAGAAVGVAVGVAVGAAVGVVALGVAGAPVFELDAPGALDARGALGARGAVRTGWLPSFCAPAACGMATVRANTTPARPKVFTGAPRAMRGANVSE